MSSLLAAVLLAQGVPLRMPPTKGNAQTRRVMVVCNVASPDSVLVTNAYLAARSIPPENVVQVRVTTRDDIPKAEFEAKLRDRIRAELKRNKNPIDFVVLTKGVPFRIDDGWGYSVDAMIAGLDLKFDPMPPRDTPTGEGIRRTLNPFVESERRFSRKAFNMVLVTRLDGYTVADVTKLIQNGVRAKRTKGPFFFDQSFRGGGASDDLDADMTRAADLLNGKGLNATLEKTKNFVAPESPLMGYVSWGSNDPQFNVGKYRAVRFLPGAIAETFVSTSARSFRPETSGQSQIGDLIRQGVTGVKGYVSEPWTIALARPSILFDRYTRGWTLAESFYAASPLAKWKDVVIGDPLVAPFAP